MNDLAIERFGEPLELCCERALFRPGLDEVVIADVHLGKAATFRAAGRPIPRGTTKRELERLDALTARKCAKRLTVLGDLFHAAVDPAGPMAESFASWLARRSDLEVVLVRGNHDRHARSFLETLPLEIHDEPWQVQGIDYRHHPDPRRPSLGGHVHPGVRIDDRADRMKLPVFWMRENDLVLPAFGEFTGLEIVEPDPHDEIAAATPTGVVRVPHGILAAR